MKLVKCINNEYQNTHLTKNKTYKVEKELKHTYLICDDLGKYDYYTKPRFTELQTEQQTEELIKPTYYNKENGISPFDYIKANNLNYFEGNLIKYITRYKEKNGLEDLLKAKTYLDELIKQNK